jgi:hypothetical protein
MHSADGLMVRPKPIPPSAKTTTGTGDATNAQAVEKTTAPLAGVAANPDAAAIEARASNAIGAGILASDVIADVENKIKVRQRLLKMEMALQKSGFDVFNEVYKAWKEETDPKAKELWLSVMQQL